MRRIFGYVFACLLGLSTTGSVAQAQDATGAKALDGLLAKTGFTFDASTLPGLLQQFQSYGREIEVPWRVPDADAWVGVMTRWPQVTDHAVELFINRLMVAGRWKDNGPVCQRATGVVFPAAFVEPVLEDCNTPVPGGSPGFFSVVHFTIAAVHQAPQRYSIYIRNAGPSPAPYVTKVLRRLITMMKFRSKVVG